MKDNKLELINSIGFDKSFEDLSLDQKADFLSLFEIPFLNKDNKHLVIEMYNKHREIVEERGLDKLILYI